MSLKKIRHQIHWGSQTVSGLISWLVFKGIYNSLYLKGWNYFMLQFPQICLSEVGELEFILALLLLWLVEGV